MTPEMSMVCKLLHSLGKRRLCFKSSFLLMLVVILLYPEGGESARAGGGARAGATAGGKSGGRTGVGRGGGRRTHYSSSGVPVIINFRNPASANYYNHPDGAQIVKSSHFELDYMLGRKITFFCMAKGLPRPHITWFKDGIELYAHKFFQVHEWTIGEDTIKSKMEIDPTTQKDAGYYECQADNQYSIDRRGFRTDYGASIKTGGGRRGSGRNGILTLARLQLLLLLISMVVYLLIHSGPGDGVGWPPGAEARRGRARGRSKSRVQIGLPITGKYRDPESDQYYNNNNGAKIILASHFDYEYVLGHKIAFLCVARGSPRPHITWFKDGTELYAHSYLHVHEWRMGKDRLKSKLEIDPATQMDAGVYECYADNMYSIDRRSFKTDFSINFD
ncbi:immunoglobulin superfamily DCC subclass member 3-like isoform X2 [Hetaerina americana]